MSAFTVWLTGLSGSGKSTLAQLLAAELGRRQLRVEIIDGDELRQHVSKGLGFSRQDRDANVRNASSLAAEVTRNGACAIVTLMSPYLDSRLAARRALGRFCEVYCDCALEVLVARDPKGLYRRARSGELRHFVGLDETYEAPEAPEVHLHTDQETPDESLQRITRKLEDLATSRPSLLMPAATSHVIVAPRPYDRAPRARLSRARCSRKGLGRRYARRYTDTAARAPFAEPVCGTARFASLVRLGRRGARPLRRPFATQVSPVAPAPSTTPETRATCHHGASRAWPRNELPAMTASAPAAALADAWRAPARTGAAEHAGRSMPQYRGGHHHPRAQLRVLAPSKLSG